MGRLTLITGGARSGKSRHAVRLAKEAARGGGVAFVATCVPGDDEMRERVKRHKEARPPEWLLLEEPERPSEAVKRAEVEVVIVDCTTLLVFNLMHAGKEDEEILREVSALADAAASVPRAAFVVTNEVGCGIVPSGALTRRFRDLCGEANQMLAERADEVVMMVSGLPLRLK